MMTAAQQVAHVAHTIDWFLKGAFRPEGFDLNWEEQAKVVGRYTSLGAGAPWFGAGPFRRTALIAPSSILSSDA